MLSQCVKGNLTGNSSILSLLPLPSNPLRHGGVCVCVCVWSVCVSVRVYLSSVFVYPCVFVYICGWGCVLIIWNWHTLQVHWLCQQRNVPFLNNESHGDILWGLLFWQQVNTLECSSCTHSSPTMVIRWPQLFGGAASLHTGLSARLFQ